MPATGAFHVAATVQGVEVSSRSTAWLPLGADRRRWVDAVHGRLTLDCRASGLLHAVEAAAFDVAGRLEGDGSSIRLPT